MRRLLLVPTALALAGAAFAQTFPPFPKSGTVFDGADLLTPDQERAISSLSRDFRHDTGAPIAVATLSSLDRYEAKGLGIQKYSTALFNEWRVGKHTMNGGILLVVAKEDRKVWVALGSDWGHDFDAKAQGVVRGTIAPLFKKGQFGEGIVQGCQALVHLADAPAGAAGSQSPAGSPATPAPFGAVSPDAMPSQGGDASSFFGGGILCFALPVLLIVVIVAAARRRRSYRPYGSGSFGPGPSQGRGSNVYNRYDDPRDDSGDFLTGVIVGQAMSQPPPVYDPNPFDNGPSYDSGSSFDSGSSDSGGSDSGGSDSGSSDSGGSFDSGSSDGGGGGGDW